MKVDIGARHSRIALTREVVVDLGVPQSKLFTVSHWNCELRAIVKDELRCEMRKA